MRGGSTTVLAWASLRKGARKENSLTTGPKIRPMTTYGASASSVVRVSRAYGQQIVREPSETGDDEEPPLDN